MMKIKYTLITENTCKHTCMYIQIMSMSISMKNANKSPSRTPSCSGEKKNLCGGVTYLVPLLDGPFKASVLQGVEKNGQVVVCRPYVGLGCIMYYYKVGRI